jgi:aminopeptidase N
MPGDRHRFRTAAHRCGVLIVLLVCAAAAAAAAATPAADDSARLRGYDVLHYRIEVRCDLARRHVTGRTTITLVPASAIRQIALDAVGMHIHAVTRVDQGRGEALAFTSDSIQLRVDLGDRVRDRGSQGRRAADLDTIVIAIAYETHPVCGLHVVGPGRSFPRAPVQLWTQGQKDFARCWFPSNDHPSDKATTEVVATLPDTLDGISNGVLVGRTAHGDGTATWHWRMDAPHATYLVALGAGRWAVQRDTADGVAIASWHAPGDDLRDAARTYRNTARMMRFFADYIGIPYPWSAYAQVSMHRFPHGGMENTSVTFMADTRMVTDARTALVQPPDALIAHELVHQWWGDLVTCRTWDHLWLNEGFATYFQQLWTAHDAGTDAFDRQRIDGMETYAAWSARTTDPGLVGAMADAPPNTYAKGAAVLHMLRRLVGDTTFRHIVHAWGERHRYGSVVTGDFQKVCEDVSGRDLGWFFAQWVQRGGLPVLDVGHEWKPSERRLVMHIRQRAAGGVDASTRWRLPLEVAVVHGERQDMLRLDLVGSDTTISVPCATEPSCVIVDPARDLLVRIRQRQSTGEWIAQLHTAARAVVRAAAVTALADDVALPDVRQALVRAAHGDAAAHVRMRVAHVLSDVAPDSLAWRGEYRALALVLAGDRDAQVRAHAFNALGRLRDAALRSGFRSASADSMAIVEVYRRGLSDSSVYVEASAMTGLLSVDSSAHAVVIARLVVPSPGEVLALAAMEIAASHRILAALPVLDRLRAPGGSRDLRIGAALCAARLGRGGMWLAGVLREMTQEDAPEIREAAVSVLRAIGVSD